ncbi:putative peptidase/amidohydrolase [Microbacterium barkeri]|uniref:Peptidase M20 domain-containing protein 2 n=1 Tax=Microbacterium barkeri TaxID=33917 RepID=A0A9W6LW42_9MICO|nr:amidohydrolase [Microbacterium barkeri]MDI6943399.1 amidohydrolase [Microbacterium barkeri]MDR6878210.1 amidohydrolase [Microbacterium barkeri]GLJ61404.1 putative peptidase/amidohydrolase [Microbacterium barkeri]
MTQPDTSDIAGALKRLRPLVHARRDLLVDVAADIHAHPEIRFTEVHAAERLSRELETAGFAVQRGFAGLDTAFVARWSSAAEDEPAPRIAVFCEYDALEGIGHGCGHNLIAAAGLGAGLALKDALEGSSTRAHVVVVGSPGEEGAAGKVPMIEGGVLDGIDAAIMIHPSNEDSVVNFTLSRVALDVTFTGRAAHAAVSPELGVNALDAATLALSAIGLLRQQMLPSDRVHGIITDGGQAPNIIPERSALRVFVRSETRAHLMDDLVPRVTACFEGAAIATGCSVEIAENTPAYHSLITNSVLGALADAAMRGLGRVPEATPPTKGSTDMGNVSQVVPAIHPVLLLDRDATPHSHDFAAAADGEAAEGVVLDGALLLAATALVAFERPELVEAAQDAFDQRIR